MAKKYCYLNGRMLLEDGAAISIADRGFRFGDGVFETLRIENGVPYQWELHLTRLLAGLVALRIVPPDIDWAEHARKLLRRNKVKDGFLRIAVSRGVGSRGYMPFPPGMPPTWLLETLPPLAAPEKPCTLWLASNARVPLTALPMQHKLAQGVGSTLALMEATDHRCDEALQLTTEGLLCEAASANLFWVKGGTLYTPALDTGCLAGTTRDAVLRLSALPSKTVQAGLSQLEKAEMVFLSNSRLGIWPVSEIQPMGWRYAPHASFLRKLATALNRDRASYALRSRKEWQ